jgi:hypothetical protein
MKTISHFVAGIVLSLQPTLYYKEFNFKSPAGMLFFPLCPLSRKEKIKKSQRPLRLCGGN